MPVALVGCLVVVDTVVLCALCALGAIWSVHALTRGRPRGA